MGTSNQLERSLSRNGTTYGLVTNKKGPKLITTHISSLTMCSGEDFFSELYYPHEIVTGNGDNVEVL